MGDLADPRCDGVRLRAAGYVVELSNATGFDFQLQDRGGLGHEADGSAQPAARHGLAESGPGRGAAPNGQEDTPEYRLDIDFAKAGALGLSQSDINNLLSTAWGTQLRQ